MTTLPQTTQMRLARPVAPTHLAIPNAAPTALATPFQQAPSATQLTGGDVLRVIRANFWLIVSVVLLAAVAGFFLNMWLSAKYARFTSTALMRVNVLIEKPRVGDPVPFATEPSPALIELEQH